MEAVPRHQCLLYAGATSRHLAAMALEIRRMLAQNYRCLYFNSVPMTARLRSCLAAAAVEVVCEIERSSLVLSSQPKHLDESGSFDVGRMIQGLSEALDQALRAGYDGLWVSGDMAWEFGPENDFLKLLEYEWRVEELFCQRPELIGVCQYHADTLPREAMRKGFLVHPALFISDTLAMNNPYYQLPEVFTEEPGKIPEVESALDQMYRRIGFN
jgi:hypothetical protein